MTRSLLKLALLSVLVSAGWVGLSHYESHNSGAAQLHDEQEKRRQAEVRVEQLKQVVKRLGVETRVADVVVADQSATGGVTRTTLLFQEYARDGAALPPKRFSFEGDEAHIDALVIQFDGKYVEAQDPLRGHSIALFTKVFGNREAPDAGHPVDVPGHIPEIYRAADPQVSEFEQQLWRDFWKLAEDRDYARQMGVRVAMGQSAWCPFHPGRVYTLSTQAAGGVVITSEPMKGIYQEMLKQAEQAGRGTTRPAW